MDTDNEFILESPHNHVTMHFTKKTQKHNLVIHVFQQKLKSSEVDIVETLR